MVRKASGQRGVVNLSQFKDFMLFYPRSKPEEIARFWKHNLVISYTYLSLYVMYS